jgi:hypothetical protein
MPKISFKLTIESAPPSFGSAVFTDYKPFNDSSPIIKRYIFITKTHIKIVVMITYRPINFFKIRRNTVFPTPTTIVKVAQRYKKDPFPNGNIKLAISKSKIYKPINSGKEIKQQIGLIVFFSGSNKFIPFECAFKKAL